MEVTPQTSTNMGPPVHSSPEMENGGANNTNGNGDSANQNNNSSNQTIGAAAAAQQPKVVQTAFIHKLYK